MKYKLFCFVPHKTWISLFLFYLPEIKILVPMLNNTLFLVEINNFG